MMLHMFVLECNGVAFYQVFETHTPHIMGILATPPKKEGLIKGLLTIGFP